MLIPKISTPQNQDLDAITSKLDSLLTHPIAHQNWTNYPSYPAVSFKIAHDGDHIYLQYKVKEEEVRAMEKGNNANVWEDSCVEFFIAFDNTGFYYNLEQSCIGETLFAYNNSRESRPTASDQIINSIKRRSSLGKENFTNKKGNFEWTLLSIIPISVFWKTKISSFDGITAKANFYKCGDLLTNPHYLSWSPVSIAQPDFHRTDFFQTIKFGV